MTYASIYIKPEKQKLPSVDNVKATTIQGQLKQAFDNAKNNIKERNSNLRFNLSLLVKRCEMVSIF